MQLSTSGRSPHRHQPTPSPTAELLQVHVQVLDDQLTQVSASVCRRCAWCVRQRRTSEDVRGLCRHTWPAAGRCLPNSELLVDCRRFITTSRLYLSAAKQSLATAASCRYQSQSKLREWKRERPATSWADHPRINEQSRSKKWALSDALLSIYHYLWRRPAYYRTLCRWARWREVMRLTALVTVPCCIDCVSVSVLVISFTARYDTPPSFARLSQPCLCNLLTARNNNCY